MSGRKIGGVKRTSSHLKSVAPVQDSSPAAESEPKAEPKKPFGGKPNTDVTAAHKVLREKDARRRELAAAGVRTPLERYRAGEYPVTEWSNDEVSRGRPANRDGSFDGPWPKFTGKQQADIRRELLRRGQSKMDEAYLLAIKVLADVAKHGEKDSDRVKAADLLMQRTAGKVPERVEIKSSDPWQDILDEIMDDEVLQRMTEPAAAEGDS